jgi:nitrate/TMAO reductase-like tetraheme cytochrome c subunit
MKSPYNENGPKCKDCHWGLNGSCEEPEYVRTNVVNCHGSEKFIEKFKQKIKVAFYRMSSRRF